jgi:hypothetical protein
VASYATIAICGACGKHATPNDKPADAGKPAATPLIMPPLGLDHVARFSYDEGPGLTTLTAKAKAKDWHGVIDAAGVLLAKDDPSNLLARRLLAAALAQTGDPAAAVDHLVAVLGADYYRFASTLADPDLESFRATPFGHEIADLAQQIHDEYGQRVAKGLWLVARRNRFRWPDKPGVQADNSRGELYAYDRASHRFLRLTHTEHQVLGFVHAPTGNEVVVLGFDRVEHDKADDVPPLFAHAWLQVFDTAEWKPVGARAVLPSTREVAFGYGNGGQILVSTTAATGRWTVADATWSSLDRTSGKLTKLDALVPAPRIVANLDDGRVVRLPSVDANWSGDPATTASFKTASGANVAIPESGQALQASVAVSPDRARIAFATAVDPCAKDAAPSLYVVDSKTATPRHILTERSRFATRWVDATSLAYDDGAGAIRIWDAATGRQSERLAEPGGMALDVLSLQNGPVCKAGADAGSGTGSGSGSGSGSGNDEMPPEEPAQ